MRISRDEQMMRMVRIIAQRGECVRRQVGAIIVDERGRILATGYNGVAPGRTRCIDSPCEGALLPSGEGLNKCEASHAEISALVTLEKPYLAHTLYCTTEPCVSCTKALLLTSVQRVVFQDRYPINGWHLWGKEWDQHGQDSV
jgi:dCMP deaminase